MNLTYYFKRLIERGGYKLMNFNNVETQLPPDASQFIKKNKYSI